MKKATLISLLSFYLIFSAGCSRDNGSLAEEATIVELIDGDEFINDSLLIKPISLCVVDGGIAVANFKSSDSLVSIYDNNGKLIRNLMPQGDGPKEAIWVSNLQYHEPTKTLYLSDLGKNAIFGVKGYASANPDINELFSYTSTSDADSLSLTGKIGLLNNGQFIAANGTTSGMLAVFDRNGHNISFTGQYPDKNKVDERLTDWANIQLYYPYLGVSPDGSFATACYDCADVRIFINEKDGDLDYKYFEDACPNDIYIIQSGPDFVQGATTGKTKMYTQDISLSNDNAYILYLGMSNDDLKESEFYKDTKQHGSNIVHVYDREGNHVKTLKLDKYAKSLAVSENDKYLYILTESSETGFSVIRYEI